MILIPILATVAILLNLCCFLKNVYHIKSTEEFNRLKVQILHFGLCLLVLGTWVVVDLGLHKIEPFFHEDEMFEIGEIRDQQVDGETEEAKAAREAAEHHEHHEILEDEAYYYYRASPIFLISCFMIKLYICIIVLMLRRRTSFSALKEELALSPTWKNYFTMIFGEFNWWSVGPVSCFLLAWVMLHLGCVLCICEVRLWHVNLDVIVRECVKMAWNMLGRALNTIPLTSHLLKRMRGANAEGEGSALRIEERAKEVEA